MNGQPAVRDAALAACASAAEALRQQTLLQALFAPLPGAAPPAALGVIQQGARWVAALAAYRANGLEHARIALRAQFPTALAMLGEAAFDAVAARYWLAQPPRVGDLAHVGADFPRCLEAQAELAAWPWLGDSARLDLALWQVLFAAPARLAEEDLQRLAAIDPAQLRVALAAGTRLLESRWPVHHLWLLHQTPQPAADALRAALRRPGETVWVWRQALQAHCRALPPAEAQWLRALRAGTLGSALQDADEDFDVSAWLQQAVAHGWIDRVEPLSGAECGADSTV